MRRSGRDTVLRATRVTTCCGIVDFLVFRVFAYICSCNMRQWRVITASQFADHRTARVVRTRRVSRVTPRHTCYTCLNLRLARLSVILLKSVTMEVSWGKR